MSKRENVTFLPLLRRNGNFIQMPVLDVQYSTTSKQPSHGHILSPMVTPKVTFLTVGSTCKSFVIM